MPNYDHGVQNTDRTLKENVWTHLKWDSVSGDDAMSEGSYGVRVGGRPYTACLHVTLEAPAGSTIRMRTYEYEYGTDANVSHETNPQTEFIATSGTTFCEYNHIGHAATDRGLMFDVLCTSAAKITKADLVVLSWK